MMTCYSTPQHDRTLRVPARACQRPVRGDTCRPVFVVGGPPTEGRAADNAECATQRTAASYTLQHRQHQFARQQTPTTRATRPRIFTCPTYLPPRLDGARPPLKTNGEEVATFSSKRCDHDAGTKKTHPTIYKQHPLQNWGEPGLRSVHADWLCPTINPPTGVGTLVVVAPCSYVWQPSWWTLCI